MGNTSLHPKYLISLFVLLCFTTSNAIARELSIEKIKLPPGFKIEIYADDVPNARSLAVGDKGTVFVGTRSGDKVYALIDEDKDGKSDRIITVTQKRRSPNGVAFHNGALYFAEVNRVWRINDIEENIDNIPEPILIRGDFPTDKHHGWKFIRFGPDGYLYIPVGAPCNVCERDDERYASIMRMKSNGEEIEIYAKGVRNSVGFDWDPNTDEMWFTDNGGDMMGDDFPPDELNHAPKKGVHFGFPYCHGQGVPDPNFGKDNCSKFQSPAQNLGPHVASLGMRFYLGSMFPKKYRNQIFIAEHGSWNRSKKIGYQISLVELEDNKPVSYEAFATGWREEEKVWGRPVDILNMPDGAILVSDDHAGAVYRISHSKRYLKKKDSK